MTDLNFKATTPEELTVLKHLTPMVSETLADKINNGVYIEKDGKRLLNKKDLSTFMDYAAEQAKNTLAENQRTGKQAVCVHGDDIMSWAIHYFEEESIEGKLYNEDGTEYQPPKLNLVQLTLLVRVLTETPLFRGYFDSQLNKNPLFQHHQKNPTPIEVRF